MSLSAPPSLNDDVLLNIFTKVGLKELLAVRLACKRWKELTSHHVVLAHHYATLHIDRAFGPAQWHSTEDLNRFLLKQLQIKANLDSDHPHHLYQLHSLPDTTDASLSSRPLVCGRFLIVLHERSTLVCRDLDDPELRVVWSHDFHERESDRSIRTCVSEATTQGGTSVLTIITTVYRTLTIFKLHVQQTGTSVKVSHSQISDSPWMWDHIRKLEYRSNWVLTLDPFNEVRLFDTTSSTSYPLGQHPGVARHPVMSFVTPCHVVILKRGNERRMHQVLEVFTVPHGVGPNPGGKLDSIYSITIAEDFYLFQLLDTRPETSCDSVRPVLVLHLIAFTHRGTLVLVKVILSPDKSSYTLTHVPTPPFTNEFTLGEYQIRAFQMKPDWTIAQVPITVSDDGEYGFGEVTRTPPPRELIHHSTQLGSERLKLVMDDIRGRTYYILWHEPNWQVHVSTYV